MIHEYLIAMIVYIAIYIIVTASFNLSFGFTGLVNLGHMVFFGIGAYSSALFTLNGVSWYFAVLLSGIIACIIGSIIAAITVRLKGDYFQIVTLGLIFMAIAISRNWTSLTRGALGLPGVPDIIKNDLYYMVFVVIVCIICVWVMSRIINSNLGKIFAAIRDDETAAQILGKNTYFYKVTSIAISTFFAGLAGSLFAHFINFVDPTIFDLEFFVLILFMLILGGLASLKGTVVGVVIVTALSIFMHFAFAKVSPELIGALRQMMFLAVLLVILIYKPKGIFGKVSI